jgi:hypothetical protein
MRTLKSSFLAVLLAVATAGAAQAATVLNSQSLEAVSAETIGLCRLVNLGTKSVSVLIEVLDGAGAVSDTDERTVAPGATADLFTGASPSTFRCRFSGSFTKGKVEALVALVNSGSMTVAVPAR